MSARQIIGHNDLIDQEFLRDLAAQPGPCVSIYLPTYRFGPDTRTNGPRLKRLIDEAAKALTAGETGVDEAERILSPLRNLVQEASLWQSASDGLALFAAPGFARWFRLPIPVAEEVRVADAFRVLPLLPVLTGDGEFLILALSQASVRLFAATRSTVEELDRGDLPGSIDEALGELERERQLTGHSGGIGVQVLHGQMSGAEVDKSVLEEYLRAVADGLRKRLGGAERRPLVLAAVANYLPVFKDVISYPNLVDGVVAGNPDRRSAKELQMSAWPVVAFKFREPVTQALAKFAELGGTGKALTDIEEILEAAGSGRVETLLFGPGLPIAEPVVNGIDSVDRAILATLTGAGKIYAAGEDLDPGAVAAVLRY